MNDNKQQGFERYQFNASFCRYNRRMSAIMVLMIILFISFLFYNWERNSVTYLQYTVNIATLDFSNDPRREAFSMKALVLAELQNGLSKTANISDNLFLKVVSSTGEQFFKVSDGMGVSDDYIIQNLKQLNVKKRMGSDGFYVYIKKGAFLEAFVYDNFIVILMGLLAILMVVVHGILAESKWEKRIYQKRRKDKDGTKEQKLKMDIDLLPIQVFEIFNKYEKWNIEFASKGSIAKKLGIEEQIVIGQSIELEKIVCGVDFPLLVDVLNRSSQILFPVNHFFRIADSAGENHWVEVKMEPFEFDRDVVFYGVLSSAEEQKLYEEELMEEKLFLGEILGMSGAIFCIRDENLNLIRLNKGFENACGYSREEICEPFGQKRLFGKEYQLIEKYVNLVIQGKGPQTYEASWINKSGEWHLIRWVSWSIKGNKEDYLISVGIDITDRVQMEAQLESSLDEIKALFDNSLVGIAVVKDHRIVKANKTASELFGYNYDEVVGLETRNIFPTAEAFEKFAKEVYPRVIDGLKHFDCQFVDKDGHLIDCKLSARPIQGNDVSKGIIYIIDDVSDYKMVQRALLKSEARFRGIFEHIASGLAIVEENGYFKEVNGSWLEMLGYNREEAKRIREIDITHPDDIERTKETTRKFFYKEMELDRYEKRYIRKNGEIIWVDITISAIQESKDNDRMVFVSMINDITERKEIEGKLISINEKLVEEKLRVQELADHRMAIFHLLDTLRNAEGMEDFTQILMRFLPRLIHYRNIFIALKTPKVINQYFVVDQLGESEKSESETFFQGHKGLVGKVLNERKALKFNDVEKYKEQYFVEADVKSVLLVPIYYKDHMWGVICLDSLEPEHFTDQDVDNISMVGTNIALQLEEKSSKMALVVEAHRLKDLHILVQRMAMMRNNEELSELVCKSGLFEIIHIHILDREGKIGPCFGCQCEILNNFLLEQLTQVLTGKCDSWNEETPVFKAHFANAIQFGGQVLGLIHLTSSQVLTEQDIEVASILCEQLAVFWELNQLIERREKEAMTDPLTGVWNRRYLLNRLEEEDERMSRYGGKGCTAILDMGDFKLINDIYGHVKGDEVLIATADVIQNMVRKTDYVGRYGGDEFIIFMPNTGIEEADKFFERLCKAVLEIKVPDTNIKLALDYGIACCPEDDPSLIGAIKVADERMYFYKRERKRRVLS